MKKLIYAMAVMATGLFVSCSDDDATTTNPDSAEITLTANAATVPLGSTVTFTVKDAENNDITDEAVIYIEGTAIEGSSIEASEAGVYQVYAKAGTLQSDNITVTVLDDDGENDADNEVIYEGESYDINGSMLVYLGTNPLDGLNYWAVNVHLKSGGNYPNSLYFFIANEQEDETDLELPGEGAYLLGEPVAGDLFDAEVILNDETLVESIAGLNGGKLLLSDFTENGWTVKYELELADGSELYGDYHGEWELFDASGEGIAPDNAKVKTIPANRLSKILRKEK